MITGTMVSVVLLVSLSSGGGQATAACLEGEGADILEAADVIVSGRIITWTVQTECQEDNGVVPVDAVLDVDHLFKGGGTPTDVRFVDEFSLIKAEDGNVWVAGASGSGVFDQDPTGRYLVLGLEERDQNLYASFPLLLFAGADPKGDDYEAAMFTLGGEPISADVLGSSGRNATAILSGLGLVFLAVALWVVARPRPRKAVSGG